MHYTLNSGVDTSTCTFKCDNCGGRFEASKLYNYSRYKHINIAKELKESTTALVDWVREEEEYNPYAKDTDHYEMIAMVCSKECFNKVKLIPYEAFYLWCVRENNLS